jgi:membrane protease subunit (stomatin/prohibitin family)
MNQTYNPCDDCRYSYSKNNQESRMCKICEFAYFRDLAGKQKKGEWINGKCSACGNNIPIKDDGKGYTWNISDYKSKYCPECGAKMNGGNN